MSVTCAGLLLRMLSVPCMPRMLCMCHLVYSSSYQGLLKQVLPLLGGAMVSHCHCHRSTAAVRAVHAAPHYLVYSTSSQG